MSNSRLAVATHIMTGIALHQDEGPVNSDYLASSVNTNPVVVRRIIQDLVKAGLLTGKAGKGGGSTLAKPAHKIDLYQIYQAVHKNSIFEYNPNDPNKSCPLSCKMKSILQPVFANVDHGLAKSLKDVKISDLMTKLK